MKINKIAFTCIIMLCSCYSYNPDVKIQREEIRKLLMDQAAAWNQGNIEGFMNGYLKDSGMQFISGKGTRYGWEKTLEAYKKHYPGKDSMGKLQFDLDSIEFLDRDAAFGHITGKWKLYRSADTPHGYFSLITRRTAEGPKIIIDHTW